MKLYEDPLINKLFGTTAGVRLLILIRCVWRIFNQVAFSFDELMTETDWLIQSRPPLPLELDRSREISSHSPTTLDALIKMVGLIGDIGP
jgi:hypothetical protein